MHWFFDSFLKKTKAFNGTTYLTDVTQNQKTLKIETDPVNDLRPYSF